MSSGQLLTKAVLECGMYGLAGGMRIGSRGSDVHRATSLGIKCDDAHDVSRVRSLAFAGESDIGLEFYCECRQGRCRARVDARGVVVVGYAAEEILALAESEQADIIVMGTRGRKGIDLILFGSVAEKVVKNATCPVLTIRPTDDD